MNRGESKMGDARKWSVLKRTMVINHQIFRCTMFKPTSGFSNFNQLIEIQSVVAWTFSMDGGLCMLSIAQQYHQDESDPCTLGRGIWVFGIRLPNYFYQSSHWSYTYNSLQSQYMSFLTHNVRTVCIYIYICTQSSVCMYIYICHTYTHTIYI